ncbi:hypothetical protein M422DRAFT_29882, partial [Sphaerobolus stellatus SS14]
IVSELWFKSAPLSRNFANRVVQIQLCTDSHDQGWATVKAQGSWSWFDIVILSNANTDVPKHTKDGHEMAWRSHANQIGQDTSTRHFGLIFDRQSELSAYAKKGYVIACVLSEDLFTPQKWTLTSDKVPKLSQEIQDGAYTFTASTGCLVQATHLEAVQLFTRSRFQRRDSEPVSASIAPGDSFSWFDIIVLEKPTDTVPKVVNGVSLVWLSHANLVNDFGADAAPGQLFDENLINEEDVEQRHAAGILRHTRSALQPGNAIAVRVCAQFEGWENYAEAGSSILPMSITLNKHLIGSRRAHDCRGKCVEGDAHDLPGISSPAPSHVALIIFLFSQHRHHQGLR